MRRITPEEVLKAYEITGLKPMQGTFNIFGGSCCAVSALDKMTNQNVNPQKFFKESGYEDDYLWGFIVGFDGGGKSYNPDGYEDGQAAWEAVKHLAEVTP